MNFLLSMSWGDFQWVEIIYSFSGSLFGFLLPILASAMYGKVSENRRLSTIRRALKGELQDVRQNLTEIVKVDTDPNVICATFETECIVWDSVKNSDIFIELIHNHNDEYLTLIKIYNRLVYLNKYEDKYDDIMIHNSSYLRSDIVKNIRSVRFEILGLIKEYMDKYGR
ncbi:MAG: hypothetical protein IJF74_01820 [Clostridia bacterium]|nr:hypothetical protein [Clostridia bacterium]